MNLVISMNVRIKRLDDYGRGIFYVQDKITFVSNALEDELIEYKIIEEKKKYNVAEVVKLYDKSLDREDDVCPYFMKCGGCHLAHIKMDGENEFKKKKVKNILKKFAGVEIADISITSLNDKHYRNKVVFTVDNHKIGFLKEKTNELVEIDYCYLINDKFNQLLEVLGTIIKMEDDISKIMLRIGNKTDEVMISIVGNVKNIEGFLAISDSLIINGKSISKGYITSYIMDKKFYLHANSFFQVNDLMVEELYLEIIRFIQKKNSSKVMDLYCGVGTIGICVSDYVDSVLGVEVVPDAIEDALKNKELNGVSNISFLQGRVQDIIKTLDFDFDTIIVDPPRSGLDPLTRSILKKSGARTIIYVSCDPVTLARDLKDLKEEYFLEEIKLFNMFPRTYHVESVCVLSRR